MSHSTTLDATPSTTSLSPNGQRAVEYAKRGWAVFPLYGVSQGPEGWTCDCDKAKCSTPGKHPRTFHGVSAATTDISRIQAWWDSFPNANIGIAMGGESGIIAIDLDGPDGMAALERAIPKGEPYPLTLEAISGREDGGKHLYFQAPAFNVKNAVKMLPDVDVRANGGYVVAAPSLHISGKRYQWVNDLEPAPLPGWLEAKLEEAGESKPANDEDFEPIEGGSRNVKLTQIAGRLRREGLDSDDIYTALQKINHKRCTDPLPDDEIRTIADSIGGTHAANPNAPTIISFIRDPEFGDIPSHPICLSAPFTDLGNAEVFATLYAGKFLHDHTRKKWMVWSPSQGKWQEDTNGAAKRAMASTLRTRQVAILSITNDRERNEKRMALQRCENGRAMESALDKAANFLGITISTPEFDTNAMTLNAKGTLLDLSRKALRSGEFTSETLPRHHISKSAGTAYDPSATAPTWEKFLHEILGGDTKLIAYVQRMIGYMLTGDTSEQSLWILFGDGANGKSTLISTIQALLGDYGKSTPFNTFDANSRNEYGNDIAALQGARFVAASETESERRLAEARVKSITGGDPLTCRFLFGEFFTYTPQFKVLLAVNHKPAIRGMDRGIWRRIKLIPFNANFEANRDTHLAEKLKAELPGILNWALAGLREWHESGMATPESVKAATEAYRRESNIIGQWIDERADAKEGASTNSTEAYLDYKQWATERGDDKPFGTRGFSLALEGLELPIDPENPDSERVKLTKRKGTAGVEKGKMFFHGLTLRPLPIGAKS